MLGVPVAEGVQVDGGIGEKRAYEPRAWCKRAEAAMAATAAG
jgi:hypothetical protein